MPILYDYRCETCRHQFEALVDNREKELPCPICHQTALRIFSFRGAMNGKSKGLFPYFDTQLGCTLESAQHRDRVAKERGLVIMGNEEWKRSRDAPRTPDPMESDSAEPTPEVVEMAKRLWDDVKYDRVPKDLEKERVMEAAQREEIVKECDVLDTAKYDGAI